MRDGGREEDEEREKAQKGGMGEREKERDEQTGSLFT